MTDPNQPVDPQKPTKKGDGWIEKLARQSSGVDDPRERKPEPKETPVEATERQKLWKLAGSGLQFAGTVALMWYLGYGLDRWMQWHGVAQIVLTSLAIVGGLYLMIKEAIKANK